jgi:hypothetical protein
MKKLNEILAELSSHDDFSPWQDPLDKIFPKSKRGYFLYTPELLIKLQESITLRDDITVSNLCLVSGADGINREFTKIFCELLKENWHDSHEDIIMILEELKDPDSIDCIYQTSLNIPNYDDGRSLAKKCIWALAAINTSKANEKLILLSNSDDQIIKEAAKMQLDHQK